MRAGQWMASSGQVLERGTAHLQRNECPMDNDYPAIRPPLSILSITEIPFTFYIF